MQTISLLLLLLLLLLVVVVVVVLLLLLVVVLLLLRVFEHVMNATGGWFTGRWVVPRELACLRPV